jgi:hypothetical protein
MKAGAKAHTFNFNAANRWGTYRHSNDLTHRTTPVWRADMKTIFASVCLLALASTAPAEAKGCIKGAIVGGVAGHIAGHGKLGAAAGCVIGHHEANKPNANPNNSSGQTPSGQK